MTAEKLTLHPEPPGILALLPADQRAVLRVLAVDDEAPACKLMALLLGPPAFHCATSSNGAEALRILARERFDVLISDLYMPVMSGMELLDRVRPLYPHMAFLVTTGVDDVEVGVQAMRMGADDYLVKPLLGGAVIASLESAVRKRQLEKEVESYRQHLEEMVEERTAQLQTALQQVETGYEHTLQALGAAIDLRDNETAGHSLRVCRYALEIARAMSWPHQLLGDLAKGAYLHDIGKLGIPDAILLKPGALTPDERTRMQQHVQIGFDLVKHIPFLADAAEMLFAHHERFDGSGYPRGLSGEEILLSARIFAVADTLDAITSNRPYRRASSFEFARAVIHQCSGTHFDPAVVRVFLSIPDAIWPAISRNM